MRCTRMPSKTSKTGLSMSRRGLGVRWRSMLLVTGAGFSLMVGSLHRQHPFFPSFRAQRSHRSYRSGTYCSFEFLSEVSETRLGRLPTLLPALLSVSL